MVMVMVEAVAEVKSALAGFVEAQMNMKEDFPVLLLGRQYSVVRLIQTAQESLLWEEWPGG